MQHIETHVGALLDDGTVTVDFEGEGNERVSVRLVASGAPDENLIVLRAKEMMVQLIAFGEGRKMNPLGDAGLDDHREPPMSG